MSIIETNTAYNTTQHTLLLSPHLLLKIGTGIVGQPQALQFGKLTEVEDFIDVADAVFADVKFLQVGAVLEVCQRLDLVHAGEGLRCWERLGFAIAIIMIIIILVLSNLYH